MKRSTFSAKIRGRWLRWIYVLCYFKINKIRPTATTKSCYMFEDKCVWSALYPISNHSHIRQLQLATHAFSQQVLQQAVQIIVALADGAYFSILPSPFFHSGTNLKVLVAQPGINPPKT